VGREPTRATTAELAGLGVLTLAAALLFGRLVGTATYYDEGVYLVSVDALEHGQALGTDVFAPQLPGWYALLRLGSLLGADTVDGFHVWMTALAVLTCLAAYAVGRRLAGPAAGFAAAGLLVVAQPFPFEAHRVLADIPALGLALAALATAGPAARRAALAGALLAAGASVKPIALVAVLGVAVLLRRGGGRAALAAGGGAAAVVLAFAAAHARAVGDLWESVVVYHARARDEPVGGLDNLDALLGFFNWRTPFPWLVALAAALTVALAWRGGRRRLAALWAGPALAAAFVLVHHPLHENHLVVLPVAFALPAGVALAVGAERLRLPAAALLALALLPAYAQQHRRAALEEADEPPEIAWAADELRAAAAPDRLVVSDLPLAAYLADRRVPGELVDTAVLRFATGSLTVEEVLTVIDDEDVAAVAAGRALTDHPALLAGLRERFERVAHEGRVRVYSDPR
jgi:hypothetical protein